MCKKIKIIRNVKVLKVPKRNIGNYLSTEVGDRLQQVASDNNIGMNSITEFALRKLFGMETKFTDIKEVVSQ
jgi:hypothetical protein